MVYFPLMDTRPSSANPAIPPAVLFRPLPSSRTSTPWAFRWPEPETAQHNRIHWRHYSSLTGRFVRPDNISGSPLNPQSWNLYSYCAGNPVNFSDPTGHMWLSPGNTLKMLIFGTGSNGDAGNTVYASKPGSTLSNLLAPFDTSSLKPAELEKFKDAVFILNATPMGEGILDAIRISGKRVEIKSNANRSSDRGGMTQLIYSENKGISGFVVTLNFYNRYDKWTVDKFPSLKYEMFKGLGGLFRSDWNYRLAAVLGHELRHVQFALDYPALAIYHEKLVNTGKVETGEWAWIHKVMEHDAHSYQQQLEQQLINLKHSGGPN